MSNTWKKFIQNQQIILKQNKFIFKNTKILTFGSCFAVELRKALRELNYNIYPNYRSLIFDKNFTRIGNLPERDNVNHYHTYSILYEFMRFNSTFEQKENDYWEVQDFWFGKKVAFQDPYRRAIYSTNVSELFKTIKKINFEIINSLTKCEIIIITLGLTEVWKKKNNQMAACMNPGYAKGGGLEETFFYASTFDNNLKNLKDIVKIAFTINKKLKIILTVSPVPLGQTFRNMDIVIANEESKSILRTAASEIVRENENVFYFPAYEYCKYSKNVFLEDGRHVKESIVANIVNMFEHCYVQK